MNKKLYIVTSLLLVALLAFSASASAASQQDKYLPYDIQDHWAFEALDDFVNADYLRGYIDQDGDYYVDPNRTITRAEFVTILVTSVGLKSSKPAKEFSDVAKGHWEYDSVRIASSLGIVNGVSATEFGANLPIKRGDIAAMVVNAFRYTVSFSGQPQSFTDVPDYYKNAVEMASQAGIVAGATKTLFKPYASTTRAQAVTILYRALHKQNWHTEYDNQLTSVLSQALEETFSTMNEDNFDQLENVMFKKYYTGYYLAYEQDAMAEFKRLDKQGATIKGEIVTPGNIVVIEKHDRFAIIKSNGGQIKITVTLNGKTEEIVSNTDGKFLLKKAADGRWKIYNLLE